MEEPGLVEQIVTRLGLEMKVLVEQVARGEALAGELEHKVQGVLRETGRELIGVLLERADGQLCHGQPLHDRRTRSIVSLFGRLDVTRGRLKGGLYPLDQALGLCGSHGWTN